MSNMESTEERLKNLSQQIIEKERRARRRAWLYVMIPMFVGIALLGFSAVSFYSLQTTNRALDLQISEKQKELEKKQKALQEVNGRLDRVQKEYTANPEFEKGSFDDSRYILFEP